MTLTLTFFESCVPAVGTDERLVLEFDQSIGGGEAHADGQLYVQPVGPRLSLSPEEIAGCYPSPGSTTSPDELLPHLALRRRTLPWERRGPVEGAPWLMVLLLSPADLGREGAGWAGLLDWGLVQGSLRELCGLDATLAHLYTEEDLDQEVRWLQIRGGLLQAVMGPLAQLSRRACMVHIPPGEGVPGTEDEDGDIALVVSPRLPDASGGERLHTALLVSVEGRADLCRLESGWGQDQLWRLPVLHRWQFVPSALGDFEYVMRSIRFAPQGGVLRFGWLPEHERASSQPEDRRLLTPEGGLSLRDEGGAERTYRGPLREAPSPHRSPRVALRGDADELDAAMDVSEAAAFELGRLRMLSDPGALMALDEVRRSLDLDPAFLELDRLPAVLRPGERAGAALDWEALVQLGDLTQTRQRAPEPSAEELRILEQTPVGAPASPNIRLSATDALSQLTRAHAALRQRS